MQHTPRTHAFGSFLPTKIVNFSVTCCKKLKCCTCVQRKQSRRLRPTSLPDCICQSPPPHTHTHTHTHTMPDRERACHWQSIQRKFHNICLLSHNGARCSTGSGAEDEAEAKLRACYCWRSCQGRNRRRRRRRTGG